VWKYSLGSSPALFDHTVLLIPAGGRVLHVDAQREEICLWVQVNPQAFPTPRRFFITGTGHPFPEAGLTHLGTVLLYQDALVVHVFEEVEE
jgi:hypothetical protein